MRQEYGKKSANSICEGFWFRSSYIGGSHEQAFSLFLLDLDVRGLRDEGGGMRDEGGRFRFRFRFRFRRFRFRQSCFNHIISKDTSHLQDSMRMSPDLAVHYISNLHANLNRPLNQVYYENGHESVKCSM